MAIILWLRSVCVFRGVCCGALDRRTRCCVPSSEASRHPATGPAAPPNGPPVTCGDGTWTSGQTACPTGDVPWDRLSGDDRGLRAVLPRTPWVTCHTFILGAQGVFLAPHAMQRVRELLFPHLPNVRHATLMFGYSVRSASRGERDRLGRSEPVPSVCPSVGVPSVIDAGHSEVRAGGPSGVGHRAV